MTTPKQKTNILHFTHHENLVTILHAGGLTCDSSLSQEDYVNVGNRRIKERRAQRGVPTPPFGVVADYVPFYFAPRSPMLFSIYKGNVPGCSYTQDQVVYLVSDAETVGSKLSWCFTDRNASLASASFFNDLSLLSNNLDWPLLKSNYWANTPDDVERVERRMAEFLAHRFLPWSFVRGIGVYDEKHLGYVKKVLNDHGDKSTQTKILRAWYF